MIVTSYEVRLHEWERRTPDQDPILAGLVLQPGARDLAAELTKSSRLEIRELHNGLEIQALSHVGRVQLGDMGITIHPKIRPSSLMNLLRYAYGFRKLRLFSEATQQLKQAGFEDLLVSQLNGEVEELLARGLIRRYVSRKEYLVSPRGRIDIQRVANDGGMVTACLPCIHHPRIENTLVNRVLLAGLYLASTTTRDLQLRRESRRLASCLEDAVTALRLDASVFEQLAYRMNRLTFAYEPALTLIQLLWQSQGVSFVGRATSVSLSGFLFDMNLFFQELLARFLIDNLPQLQVKQEHRLRGMMQYLAGYNPNYRQSPSPRPDFVVLEGNKTKSMLDAKYRDLWERSLPRDMLYQLVIYAVAAPDKVATILYPTTDTKATEARIAIRDPVHGANIAQVRLRPVDMPLLEEMVLEKPTAASKRRRTQYALWMSFGDAIPK